MVYKRLQHTQELYTLTTDKKIITRLPMPMIISFVKMIHQVIVDLPYACTRVVVAALNSQVVNTSIVDSDSLKWPAPV